MGRGPKLRISRAVTTDRFQVSSQVQSSCAGSGFSFAFSVGVAAFSVGAGLPSLSNRVVATDVVLSWWDHKPGDRARLAVDDLVAGGGGPDGSAKTVNIAVKVDCHEHFLFVCRVFR